MPTYKMKKETLVEELQQALQTLLRIESLIDTDIPQAKWELQIAIRRIEKLGLE